MEQSLNLVFLGLSLTSTWGNGHATTYRALLKYLAKQGHNLTFLERDVPWYAENREFSSAPYCAIGLYQSLEELRESYRDVIRNADAVVVGSYVPDGISVGKLVLSVAQGLVCFYDIDTPVTQASLRANSCEYLSRELCRAYDLYLSFTGGPMLAYIETVLESPAARALYCSVDPDLYYPDATVSAAWDIGYLGTYAPDRQPALEQLLFKPALDNKELSAVVAGPQYPTEVSWPTNVARIEHLPAKDHCSFYNAQKFTLNLTRKDMVAAGYSPSVRLFEAAACGTPIISDEWPGLETIFEPGTEVLPVRNHDDVTSHLQMAAEQRAAVGQKARERVLRFHTASVRARQLVEHITEAQDLRSRRLAASAL